jgi:hypothetical protein
MTIAIGYATKSDLGKILALLSFSPGIEARRTCDYTRASATTNFSVKSSLRI